MACVAKEAIAYQSYPVVTWCGRRAKGVWYMSGLLSFSEYKSRIQSAHPADVAEKMLWNSLCRYGLAALGCSTEVEYATLQLPKSMLLRLSPEQLSTATSMPQVLLDLYKVLHSSLRQDERGRPRSSQRSSTVTCQCSGKISRESLIACTGWRASFAGSIWNSLLRWSNVRSDGIPTLQQIRAFCAAVEEEGGKKKDERYVARIASANIAKLKRWMQHLEQ